MSFQCTVCHCFLGTLVYAQQLGFSMGEKTKQHTQLGPASIDLEDIKVNRKTKAHYESRLHEP